MAVSLRQVYVCKKCGYKWYVDEHGGRPDKCPKCGSSDWKIVVELGVKPGA